MLFKKTNNILRLWSINHKNTKWYSNKDVICNLIRNLFVSEDFVKKEDL